MTTIYEQIGGAETIDKLIGSFYRLVLADPQLSPFFENTSVEKLHRMQKAFFTIALGGPDPEVKISIYEAHRGRGIKREHLTRFTEHLMNTLHEVGVEEENAKSIYQRLSIYADDVLERLPRTGKLAVGFWVLDKPCPGKIIQMGPMPTKGDQRCHVNICESFINSARTTS